tara:strand:- start:60 stop:335 length:276 start_codon:yes stop_codon:yes gene_type:complete
MFCDVVRIDGHTVPERLKKWEERWGMGPEAFNVFNYFYKGNFPPEWESNVIQTADGRFCAPTSFHSSENCQDKSPTSFHFSDKGWTSLDFI